MIINRIVIVRHGAMIDYKEDKMYFVFNLKFKTKEKTKETIWISFSDIEKKIND